MIRSWFSHLTFGLGLAYVVFLVGYLTLRWTSTATIWWLDLLDTFAVYLFAPTLALLLLGVVVWSRPTLLLCTIPVALFVLFFSEVFLPHLPKPVKDGSSFTVMTYNILGMNRDFRSISRLIEQENPDVIAIQELTPEISTPLLSILSDEYQYRALAPRADFTGVGVFSRFPIVAAETFMAADTGNLSQRLLLDVHGQKVYLFNLHPDHPHIRYIRREGFPPYMIRRFETGLQTTQVETMMEEVEKTKGPVLVMGDFNLTDQTRQYRRITRRLVDTYREVGWGLGFTFPANGRLLSLPLPFAVIRIDYIFHSPELAATEAHLGAGSGSDHRPVIAKMGFRAE